VSDLLARDLAETLDAATWAARVLGHRLDDWQKDVVRGEHARLLLNVTRQGGKSTAAALLALHVALTEPGVLVLLLSPTQRQSGELLHTVAGLHGADESAITADAESALKLELANGSRIISLPGQERTVRGYASVRLLVIDEAARVADALYYSVRPMLAVSGGDLVAMSTPFGKRGWWWQEWTEGADWVRIQVTADRCPRITAEFLARERAAMPEWSYVQEYWCAFSDSADQLFGTEYITAALDPQVLPLFGGAGCS